MYKAKTLKQTCSACPSQWDCYTEDGDYLYIRYRHGRFTVNLNPKAATYGRTAQILFKSIGTGGDGIMDTEEMKELTKGIIDWNEN